MADLERSTEAQGFYTPGHFMWETIDLTRNYQLIRTGYPEMSRSQTKNTIHANKYLAK